MGIIKYDPELSIAQIARQSGNLSEAAVRKYIRDHFIDREFDTKLIRYRKVQQYFREHSDATLSEAAKALGKGFSRNTVSYYRDCNNAPVPDKDKFSLSLVAPSMTSSAIASVSDEDRIILSIIMRQHLGNSCQFDCDLTFSKGDFYRYGVHYPRYCFDLYPEQPKHLPDAPKVRPLHEGYNLPDNSLSSVIIDLPQTISNEGEKSADAFQNLLHLALSYYDMLKLAYHKLRYQTEVETGGMLIVKVGDIPWKGNWIWMSKIVTEFATGKRTCISDVIYNELKAEAQRRGNAVEDEFPLFDLELVDKYVHVYKHETVDNSTACGHRSVKAHDYFLVFKKGMEKVSYDIFFGCCDNADSDIRKQLDENGVVKVVSRLSQVKGEKRYSILLPKPNELNHINLDKTVAVNLIELISKELDGKLPIYQCAAKDGGYFLQILRRLVKERLFKEHGAYVAESLVSQGLYKLLRKCGVLYIQEKYGDKRRGIDTFRTIINREAIINITPLESNKDISSQN